MRWYVSDHNPVLWHELRRRTPGYRGYKVLVAYLAILSLALLLLTLFACPSSIDRQDWANFGQLLWRCALVGQALLALLLTPVLTATAITAERQHGSLEALLLTPLSAKAIIYGKLWGAIAHLSVFLFAGLPIIATFVFLFGGVSPLEVLLGYLLIGFLGFFCAAHGLLVSCQCKSTTTALIKAYVLIVPAALLAGLLCITIVGIIVIVVDLHLTIGRCFDYIDLMRWPQ